MKPTLLHLTTDARHQGRRLDEIAREWLTEVLGVAPARAAVRRLIMAGALRARGQPLRAPGHIVEARMNLALSLRPDLVRRDRVPVTSGEALILYEDDALLAVDKPPGLPTVATADPERAHLVGLVERVLQSRAGGKGRPRRLGVHQRLDRDTSGVVLFVKDPAANPGLAAQFAARTIEKTYLALTARPARMAASAWRVDEPVERPGAGPVSAVTDFAIVEAWPEGVLVEARPRTGRKHQVRIHLSRAGLPILGDAAYGGDPRAAPRVMLHAARLQLRHPLTGAGLSVASPMPADFRAVLDRLRHSARRSARRGTRPRR